MAYLLYEFNYAASVGKVKMLQRFSFKMNLLAVKSTTNICKRVASNVYKIQFKRKFQELLLLQGKVAHQKHHPLFPGHLMLFGRVEVKAPQLLPGLIYTHNPIFHDNIFIAEWAHFL